MSTARGVLPTHAIDQLLPLVCETLVACNVQLMLQWRDGEREARLYKGAAPGVARTPITAEEARHITHETRHAHCHSWNLLALLDGA